MDSSSFLWGAAFGGIGVFVTGFLKKAGEDSYSWIKRKINPNAVDPNQSHIVIHMKGDNSSSAEEGHSVLHSKGSGLEYVYTITIDEINSAVLAAPPLQRSNVAKRFVGLRIEWDTNFVGGKEEDNDKITLHLRPAKTDVSLSDISGISAIWCTVPASEYRELGILPKDSKIRVSGEIDQITDHAIYVKEARLHIYGM
jgi:hypothetical protein